MSMCFGLLGLLGLKEPWHQAVDAAFLVVVLLLALAGLYYLVTHYVRGYDWRVQGLPYETMACPVNAEGKRQKHYLVYVNKKELDKVKEMAGHQGKPCHGIDSYPKRTREGYEVETSSGIGRLSHGDYWTINEHGHKSGEILGIDSLGKLIVAGVGAGGRPGLMSPQAWWNENRRYLY